MMSKTEFKVRPTILFIRENAVLKQVVMAEIGNEVPGEKGKIKVEMLNESFEINLNLVSPYSGKYIIGVPEVSQPTPAEFTSLTTGCIVYAGSST